MSDNNPLKNLLTSLSPEGRTAVADIIESGDEKRIRALQDKLNTSLSSLADTANSTDKVAALADRFPTLLDQINQGQREADINALTSAREKEVLAGEIDERKTQQILNRVNPLLDREYGAQERRDDMRSGMYDKQLDYQRGLNNKQLIRDLVLGGMFMFGG
tara:strand:- start:20331 stop:20813 length:483 start_codon:yes stop_codon:yes gene_type:complete